jgi:hypothetical protein
MQPIPKGLEYLFWAITCMVAMPKQIACIYTLENFGLSIRTQDKVYAYEQKLHFETSRFI